ncbi:MAG: hypothetical protein HZC40_11445 [Chloroflexi bacterium]|nr:hypothetical protein [Chloroflexota bacterium]
MALMVRKQVYLKKEHALSLKRQARARGISEAELIRESIARQIENTSPPQPDPQAWARAHKFMLALHAQGPIANRPRRWTREELYEG